jgi:hypothetical protein
VFRSDAAELTGSDDARLLARQTRTLAELLTEAGWRPGASNPAGMHPGATRAIAQVHCRTQIQAGHLGREGIHLAQLLAGMLGDRAGQQGTEDRS